MGPAVYVTVLGMVLVFAALTIVMFIAIVLERLFRVQPEKKAPCAEDSGPQTEEEELARVAAAIGAAMAILALETEAELPEVRPASVLDARMAAQGWKAAGRLDAVR